jgi:hypothetical protein
MSRRDAVRAAGAALAAASGALAACGRDRADAPAAAPGAARAAAARPGMLLGADDEALAEAVADTLLPTTAASPGARAAGAGAAMNLLVTDCYEPDAQRRFARGLAEVRAASGGRAFAALPQAERERVVREVDAAAARGGGASDFSVVREVAERAYFSSEVGMTRALRYVRVPGRWDGCTPLAPGQPAWG